jgi:DNA-directed RNA polymerase II subunit RPB1
MNKFGWDSVISMLWEILAGQLPRHHGKCAFFGQMASMGTGSFSIELDLDMLKDIIIDHSVPWLQESPMALPGGMTLYDSSLPMWDQKFQGDAIAFSPLAQSGEEDPTNFATYLSGLDTSPFGAGMGSQLPGNILHQYNPSSPGYSPMSPFAPTSLYGTSPFATSLYFNRSWNSGTYPASPILNLTSPAFSPTLPAFSPTSPRYLLTSPSFSPTSPQYSPTSPRYSPTSPSSVQRGQGTHQRVLLSVLHPHTVSLFASHFDPN